MDMTRSWNYYRKLKTHIELSMSWLAQLPPPGRHVGLLRQALTVSWLVQVVILGVTRTISGQ
jgi:hypothetical protein